MHCSMECALTKLLLHRDGSRGYCEAGLIARDACSLRISGAEFVADSGKSFARGVPR